MTCHIYAGTITLDACSMTRGQHINTDMAGHGKTLRDVENGEVTMGIELQCPHGE